MAGRAVVMRVGGMDLLVETMPVTGTEQTSGKLDKAQEAVADAFDRAQSAGIEAMVLSPQCGDFNEDLRNFDINALRAALRIQIAQEDIARFLSTRVSTGMGDEALTLL